MLRVIVMMQSDDDDDCDDDCDADLSADEATPVPCDSRRAQEALLSSTQA